MSTGISMSSVNKIKELAENGDYSLALDILEHQDLSKSLSPQFIRICGEVYYENQKYPEARAALVKAHSMAPMGNKIIFSMIKLYLSMGLFQLAEHYFEIYKFNQNTRDVGTVRIEYLIAKAYRKSIIELYSILISANEMETDEEWDLEMLFIHAAMKNGDKLKNESSIFKATYKNSTKLNEIEMLLQDMDKACEYIYIYPENAVEDTDEAMEETRQLERRILDEDNLRMNPKDPKIMIMVEDDEPVPSSVKLKTMFSRSKENKKEKKERKAEGKEEKTGWFGKNRMSKKDEEAFEEAVNEMAEGDAGRQELLDEVLKSDDTIEQTDAKASEEMVEITDTSDISDKVVYNDNVDDISEKIFEEAMDDFSVDDDIETVVMVDVDSLSDEEEMVEEMAEPADEFEVEETAESADEFAVEEMAEPVDEFAVEEMAEPVDAFEVEKMAEPADAFAVEEMAEPVDAFAVEEMAEPADEFEVEETAESADEFAVEEMAESADLFEPEETNGFADESEIEEVETFESEAADEFDFDSAFESLDGFEMNEMSEAAENIEAAEEPKIEEPKIEEPETVGEFEAEASELEKETGRTDIIETSELAAEPEMEEPISENESDADFIVFNENETDNFNNLEYESDTDAIPMVEISEMELFDDIFDESDGFESDFSDEPEEIVEVELEVDSDMESYNEPETVEAEAEPGTYDESQTAEVEAESGTYDDEPEAVETEAESGAYDESEAAEAEAEPEMYDEPETAEAEAEPGTYDDEPEAVETEIEFGAYDEPKTVEAEAEPGTYDELEIAEAEAEPEAYDEPETAEAEAEPEMYDESETAEVESVMDKEPKEEKTENILYRRNIDFPVFKTSLFPDYNRDNPPVYTPPKKKVDEVSSEQEKINENLKKEEDLLSETDRLLARLGIELGTDYHSGVDFEEQSYDNIKSYDSERTPGTEEKADMKDKNPFKLRF